MSEKRQSHYTNVDFDAYKEITLTEANRSEFFIPDDLKETFNVSLQHIKSAEDSYFTISVTAYIKFSDELNIPYEIYNFELLADQKKLTSRSKVRFDEGSDRIFSEESVNPRGYLSSNSYEVKQYKKSEFDFEASDILKLCNSQVIEGRVGVGTFRTQTIFKPLPDKITQYLRDELCLLYNDAIGEGVNQHNLERARAKRAEIETQREEWEKFSKEFDEKGAKYLKILGWILLLIVASCSAALFS
nr:hypothetical protein 3 [Paracoccaceae bacterium]